MYRWMNGWVAGRTGKRMEGCTNGWVGVWVYGCAIVWLDGLDGWSTCEAAILVRKIHPSEGHFGIGKI